MLKKIYYKGLNIANRMINELQSAKNIHFIGIGGSGMSGLARILNIIGKKISGSDQNVSNTFLALKSENLKIHAGHKAQNIPAKTDLVVYSAAVPKKNPELLEAQKRKLPCLTYPQAVGLLTQHYQTISICGTHGKTTVTAMTALSFAAAKQDPTVIVGATLKEFNHKNERFGKSEYFILESCEYRRGFLNYHPKVIVITNIEPDHLDYYKNLQDYRSAFQEFCEKLPKDGLIICNSDDENINYVMGKIKNHPKIITFGTNKKADYQIKSNKIYHNKKLLGSLDLKIPGQHNLMNAAAAIALTHHLKFDLGKIFQALNNYHGASRRFEVKGKIGKTVFIDDYGHHPTEIKATLKAAREKFGKKKILCIFQPHQYSRTYKLLNGFADSFNDVDEVIIPNILNVRDSAADLKKINEQILVQKIAKFQPNVSYGKGLENTTKIVQKKLKDYDVIITMGAGDVYKLADNLLKKHQ
ncbi:MAG: UDP-N-acetylmuramate--L-alanine ligase [Candidatus Gracilibacteria bacterium]|jgi:UDP-N-acetylmuramate--alanine ligase